MSASTITDTSTMTLVAKAEDGAQAPFVIPWPESKIAQRQWQLEQMAGAFRVFAKLGFADGGSGHISLRGKPLGHIRTLSRPKDLKPQ